MKILTEELADGGGRFKRVEMLVLSMLRFTDEVAEHIKLSR